MQCAVSSVQCAVFSIQCAGRSVQCAVCSEQCVVCDVQCAMCNLQCAVYSVQCALYSTVQYTLQSPTRVELSNRDLIMAGRPPGMVRVCRVGRVSVKRAVWAHL